MKVGYDLDGVLLPVLKRPKPYFKQSGQERKEFKQKRLRWFQKAPIILRPSEKKFYIISGRKESEREITEGWLTKYGLYPEKLILLSKNRTRKNMIEHKYQWIKELELNIFYEDDLQIVKPLQKRLPQVRIVHLPPPEINCYLELDKIKNLNIFNSVI